MSITGPAVPPPARARRRRRTWRERRHRRGAAFDLLAVAAALALVGLGLANLALTGAPELAVRQAMIAGGGLLALTAFWRLRVRLLGVLGWLAYGASVALLAGVLVAGASANGATRWIAVGSLSRRSWPSSGCCWSSPACSGRACRHGSASWRPCCSRSRRSR